MVFFFLRDQRFDFVVFFFSNSYYSTNSPPYSTINHSKCSLRTPLPSKRNKILSFLFHSRCNSPLKGGGRWRGLELDLWSKKRVRGLLHDVIKSTWPPICFLRNIFLLFLRSRLLDFLVEFRFFYLCGVLSCWFFDFWFLIFWVQFSHSFTRSIIIDFCHGNIIIRMIRGGSGRKRLDQSRILNQKEKQNTKEKHQKEN